MGYFFDIQDSMLYLQRTRPSRNPLLACVCARSMCKEESAKRAELRELHTAEVIASHSGLFSHHCR